MLNNRWLLKSIFLIHNETFNIWTHLLPAVYFLLSLILVLFDHTHCIPMFSAYQVPQKETESRSILLNYSSLKIVLVVSLVPRIICFSFSSVYHIFKDKSKK
jgi:predicted membrane channel-forming protein YqfA (hemolysin III family)